ncbi:MAG: LysM peptidoglycan-binding domain-containing protein [Rhizobiaceae bacterium]
MTNGIRNALLFGGGALVAALAVAYGLGAFNSTPPAKVAESVAPAENSMTAKEGRAGGAPANPAADATTPEKAGSAPASTTPQPDKAPVANGAVANDAAAGDKAAANPDAKSADVTAPSFDVVRAEGNGSIVVAGRSAPRAKVEILSGASVLGSATAGPEGDFAIVLDDPLKPGDYQLVLRSTSPANVVAMSKQTAVVSIPEHQDGQVLALVEAPGQPSKLITVPQPDKAAAKAPAPDVPATTATPQNPATAMAEGRATAPGPKATTPPAAGAGSGSEVASADANVAGKAPATPQAGAEKPATTAQISVEAVEIEGNKIFVAGIADPGSTVRVYANDTVLGEAKTSPVGRFLVESIHELAVGDYIIRADMLAADGLKVAARAAVPFTRAPGESVAAVASGEAGSGNTADKAAGGEAPASAEGGKSGPPPTNDMKAAASPQPAGGAEPSKGAGGEAPQVVASGSTVLPPLGNEISKQPPTIVAPKLENTTGAVIIRRGDTLWQISRRVYGHGVRYSTIYLANQDQIENPDLIWPGQIFAVPNESGKGEAANMNAIAGQVTQMPKKAIE